MITDFEKPLIFVFNEILTDSMTDKDRRIKEKLVEDLLKIIPIIIETERERGTSEREIFKMIDHILDRVNQLRQELRQTK